MEQLEKGKLYQVRNYKGWVIAEYVNCIEAHETETMSVSFSLKVSKSRQVHVPTTYYWKPLTGAITFGVHLKDLQVRPVTEETLAEISRLKGEIERLRQEQMAVIKELKELCA